MIAFKLWSATAVGDVVNKVVPTWRVAVSISTRDLISCTYDDDLNNKLGTTWSRGQFDVVRNESK